jgi:High potential iron-sulfur protein
MRDAITRLQSPQIVAGISRRQILKTTGVAIGSLVAILATVPQAVAKMAQKAAGYQTSAKNGQSCANCALFKAPSSCTLVDGTISPDGWCRFYAKKTS